MEEIRKKINDLFDSGLRGEELVLALEKVIKNIVPYNHDISNPMDACGIGSHIELKIVGSGTISQIVEKIEKSTTKRKLAFVLFRKILEEKEGEEEASRKSGSGKSSSFKSIGKVDSNPDSDLESMVRVLMGYDAEAKKHGKTPSTCQEEDDSECWKCRHNGSCHRKDSFDQ